jgi:hypothetical protein
MSHDMQALMHMVACVIEEKIRDVYFPLTCTVDFRGFRIYGAAATPHITAAAAAATTTAQDTTHDTCVTLTSDYSCQPRHARPARAM